MLEIIVIVVLSMLSAACIVVVGCDAFPSLGNWLGRIHIGKYENYEQWYNKVSAAANKQIKKLPPMPVTDRTAYTIVPRIKGEYKNRKFNAWQQACLLLGLESKTAGQYTYDYFVDAELEKQDYTPGNAMLLYSLMSNGYENDERLKRAADDYCEKVLIAAGEGTLPYNPSSANRYVDVLGMVCPFLVRYHISYGCPKALELVKRQFDEFYEYGVNTVNGLPAHCYNVKTKMPLGVFGWGRGCGWLAFALGECFLLLNGKDSYADVLLERAEALAKSVGRFQNRDGSFSCVFGSGQRSDSSATAMLGCFFAFLATQSKNKEYSVRAQAARKYLISVTRRNGKVDFAQGDTMGIGNYSRRFEPLPVSLGFSLKLCKMIESFK